MAGADGGPAGRFTLEAVLGARGSNQSSAYRLDRVTGEICRFRLSAKGSGDLELLHCVAKPPAATAR